VETSLCNEVGVDIRERRHPWLSARFRADPFYGRFIMRRKEKKKKVGS